MLLKLKLKWLKSQIRRQVLIEMGIDERNQIIENYLPLIYKIAHKIRNGFVRCDLELDELVSYGAIGAMKAIEKFDKSKGEFKTYLYLRIKNEMIDGLRKTSRFSRVMMMLIKKYNCLKDDLNREPTNREMFDEFGIDEMSFSNFLIQFNGWKKIISLNSLADSLDDNSAQIQELVVDTKAEEELINTANKDFLQRGFKRLTKKEMGVIWLHFYEGLLIKDIAIIRKCHPTNISNTKVRAIKKLREFYAC